MRKILVILAVLLSGMVSLQAAENAQSVLRHVVDRMRSGAVEVNFVVTASGINGTGHLILDGKKFVVETEDISTWYDGKTQWTLSPAVKEVTVTEPTVEELSEINPLLVLSGLSAKYNTEMVTSTAGLYEIALVAKGRDDQIASARVKVDSNTWWPKSLDIITRSGQKFKIVIKSIKNIKIDAASRFKFNRSMHKDVEVIDLR